MACFLHVFDSNEMNQIHYLLIFNNDLQNKGMIFIGLDKSGMTITKSSKLKIINGNLLYLKQFELLKKIINNWYPKYIFINYNSLSNIYH